LPLGVDGVPLGVDRVTLLGYLKIFIYSIMPNVMITATVDALLDCTEQDFNENF